MQQSLFTVHTTSLENRATFFDRIQTRWPEDTNEYHLIERAYQTAKDALRGVMREDGIRYFEHPRGVALVLLEVLKVRDPYLIALALLHDVVEENPADWGVARIHEEFGEEIADGVRALTKPIDLWMPTQYGPPYHASFWHAPKAIVTVKLADRYHNLLTLDHCSLAKQLRKREETRRHYLPLAKYWGILDHEIEMVLATPPHLRLHGTP